PKAISEPSPCSRVESRHFVGQLRESRHHHGDDANDPESEIDGETADEDEEEPIVPPSNARVQPDAVVVE
ncbi:hypothetical protein PENTCL1PPCAC_20773, partial [Pristionchus entomophagus]